MLYLDLDGLRINRFRFFHSKKFRGFGFLKARKTHENSGDISSEKNIISEYLIEKCEMDYTYFNIYQILSILLIALIILLMLTIKPVFWISLGFLGLSVIFYSLSRKRKDQFVMGEVGINMMESYYNNEIKEKFNL